MYFFRYDIDDYNEIENRDVRCTGIVPAESLVDALQKLDEYYDLDRVHELSFMGDDLGPFENVLEDKQIKKYF